MGSSDNLTKYTGSNYEDLGIKNGMTLDIVITNIIESVLALKNNKIDIDGTILPINEAISFINNKSSEINSDKIILNGDYEIGISMATQPFLSKSFSYTTDITANNLIYSFDFNSIKENLPADYNLIHIRTTASSILNSTIPNTLIQDNDRIAGTIAIPLTSLPANVRTDIRYNTPNGDIVLNASMPITSALKTTGIIVLNINDYTTNKSTNKSITDWSKVITSQINNINNVKNQLDQFMISGFENVPEQKGILNCISALTSICDSVIKDIEDLNTLSIPDFGTCVGSKNGSPQDAVDALSQAHITQQAEINKLKLELENQNKEINNLRGFYSSIVNDQSGGTLSTQNIGTNTDGTVTVIKGGCGAGGTCP